MKIYANENDPRTAHWLSCLPIKFDRIDDRSIADVRSDELTEFTQCHFFAGIGGWPYALKLAGWPDDVEVWTGSCPCQPFSAAGKQQGEKDSRHLWPEFRRLIADCRPPIIFGEQVASKLGRQWLSRVRADMEALGYGFGAADLCAAGEGSPHIRQRLFWCAYHPEQWREMLSRRGGFRLAQPMEMEKAREGVRLPKQSQRQSIHASRDYGHDQGRWSDNRPHQHEQAGQPARQLEIRDAIGKQPQSVIENGRCDETKGADAMDSLPLDRQEISVARIVRDKNRSRESEDRTFVGSGIDNEPNERVAYSEGWQQRWPRESDQGGQREVPAGGRRSPSGVVDTPKHGSGQGRRTSEPDGSGRTFDRGSGGNGIGLEHTAGDRRIEGRAEPIRRITSVRRGETGAWSEADYLYCTDHKYRPVESGTFPLAHGIPGRVAQLRGLGNAIVPQLAATFIRSTIEAIQEVNLGPTK